MSKLLKLIKKQNKTISNTLYDIIPFRYRYGSEFKKTIDFLLSSEEWSYDKLKEYQLLQLQDLLIHSYETVEYYNKLFKKYDLNPYNIKDPSEIKVLPFLTKDIINNNFSSLLSSKFHDKKLYTFKTSGSTGKKLKFLGDDNVFKREAAFILRAYYNHGATLYDKPSIWLRRYVPEKTGDPLWTYNHELRRLYMSPYHLESSNLEKYLSEMSKRKYHTMVGYPSSLYIFALLLEEHGLQPPKIKALHAASEKMLPEWSIKISKVFGIQVKCHYGLMEKVSLMHQKHNGDQYYDNLEYGYTEILDDGSIVGTGFINYAMPFIRYKTNDMAIKSNVETKIGLPAVANEIIGRSDDFLRTSTGARVPPVNFYTMMYKIDGVKMFQIIQRKDNSIDVSVVTDKKNKKIVKNIKNNLTKRLKDVIIRVELVDNINRNKNTNKIRCIINENK